MGAAKRQEAKPSPGPWRTKGDKYGNIHAITTSVGRAVCLAPWTIRRSYEARADANLIAAAPELLAALEEVQEELVDKAGAWAERLLAITDAAMAKARGES